jgi:hypothetical protein
VHDLDVPRSRRLTLPALIGVALAVAAAVMLLIRLPGAFHSFNTSASAAAGRNELGGALQTADSVGMNDDFVRDAFKYVPKNARFVVVLPPDQAAAEKTYGVNALTFAAAPTLLEDFLLPRRWVPKASPGTYILCYFCDSPYWDEHAHWLANNHAGGLVGLVYR